MSYISEYDYRGPTGPRGEPGIQGPPGPAPLPELQQVDEIIYTPGDLLRHQEMTFSSTEVTNGMIHYYPDQIQLGSTILADSITTSRVEGGIYQILTGSSDVDPTIMYITTEGEHIVPSNITRVYILYRGTRITVRVSGPCTIYGGSTFDVYGSTFLELQYGSGARIYGVSDISLVKCNNVSIMDTCINVRAVDCYLDLVLPSTVANAYLYRCSGTCRSSSGVGNVLARECNVSFPRSTSIEIYDSFIRTAINADSIYIDNCDLGAYTQTGSNILIRNCNNSYTTVPSNSTYENCVFIKEVVVPSTSTFRNCAFAEVKVVNPMTVQFEGCITMGILQRDTLEDLTPLYPNSVHYQP